MIDEGKQNTEKLNIEMTHEGIFESCHVIFQNLSPTYLEKSKNII